MAKGSSCIGATHFVILAILVVATTVSSDDTTPIPAADSQVRNWFNANVKPYASRKGTLDAALEAAEAKPRTIKVSKDGKGDFKTVTDAIKSIPSGNIQRVIVNIGPGVYTEKITIDRTKPFITFRGAPNAMPTLAFGGMAKQPDGITSGAQAVALRISGDKAAFYNCRILGFQDTVCDDRGHHFFKNCYIEGTVDFIFGSGKSLYLETQLNVIADQALTVITAQARKSRSEDNGYSFVHCRITGSGSGTYLGRAWMDMPEVVFAYTDMGTTVNPLGWSNNFHPERESTVFFGEYKNSGAGSNPRGRVKFTRQLTDAGVKRFLSLGYIQGSKWLLPPPM
ncbi:hypothetical protein GH714_040421 [Hevea brasiliensis]|uniref:Pectinesterase n=1 Tax=Hevea brasiliensis TaxID=3981 RepID=A0A6A6N5A8_HEVBR|nr:hypothetical protein GH714_040421 [Hevea brasiliensis]